MRFGQHNNRARRVVVDRIQRRGGQRSTPYDEAHQSQKSHELDGDEHGGHHGLRAGASLDDVPQRPRGTGSERESREGPGEILGGDTARHHRSAEARIGKSAHGVDQTELGGAVEVVRGDRYPRVEDHAHRRVGAGQRGHDRP